MHYLLLPNNLRNVLANLHTYAKDSIVFLQGSREYIGFKLRTELYPYIYRVVAVGDIVCSTIIEYIGAPRICIIDGKTLREKTSNLSDIAKTFNNVYRCRNPPSTISEQCLYLIKSLIYNQDRHMVIVDGEEDLLTLAVAISNKDINYIVYGVPLKGVAIIDVEKFIVTAINIISQFNIYIEAI